MAIFCIGPEKRLYSSTRSRGTGMVVEVMNLGTSEAYVTRYKPTHGLRHINKLNKMFGKHYNRERSDGVPRTVDARGNPLYYPFRYG